MVEHELQELNNGSKYIIENYDAYKNLIFKNADTGSRKMIGRIKQGWLHGKQVSFFLKYEKEGNRLRKLNAWTIPVCILDKVDYIYYQTDEDIYKISTFNAYQYGQFQTFNNEEKLCVPVRFWEQKSEMEDDE